MRSGSQRGFGSARIDLRQSVLLTVILLASCILAVVVWFIRDHLRWSGHRIAQSQRIGDEIVQQLVQFRNEKGIFPENLDELVPHHFSSIPTPLAGSPKWKYRRTSDGGDFTLTFAMPSGYPSCFYVYSLNSWYVDQ
jgi:hypothetical protein